MSSFVGHSLAALTIGKIFQKKTEDKIKTGWFLFLVFCSVAPDFDYIFKSLNSVHNGDLRITHSIGYCLFLPLSAMFYFSIFNRKFVWKAGLQAFLAGFSHLVLDGLVGGRQGDPWFYPLWDGTILLPFGLLPSAGAIRFYNYYLYRNSLIELGILLPAAILLLNAFKQIRLQKFVKIISIVFLTIFLVWSINLTR